MIFLIEYDRNSGRIVSKTPFQDLDREHAYESRLQLELELHAKKVHHEVVLLEASTEEDLWRTHARYFRNLSELATAMR